MSYSNADFCVDCKHVVDTGAYSKSESCAVLIPGIDPSGTEPCQCNNSVHGHRADPSGSVPPFGRQIRMLDAFRARRTRRQKNTVEGGSAGRTASEIGVEPTEDTTLPDSLPSP